MYSNQKKGMSALCNQINLCFYGDIMSSAKMIQSIHRKVFKTSVIFHILGRVDLQTLILELMKNFQTNNYNLFCPCECCHALT